jgi:moderate conductance mechanosensitive channel
MRFTSLLALFLAFAFCTPAAAQSILPHLAAPAAGTAASAPAKPPASAIIPGSPLAALTGAAVPANADADANAPAPFGTSAIGLSITSEISTQATKSFGAFLAAIRQSTRLTPVIKWLRSFASTPVRLAHLLDILRALAITILPGLFVETAIRLALTRPRAMLANRVALRAAVPVPENSEAQGLADAEAGETEKRSSRRVSLLTWGRRLLFSLLHFSLRVVPLIGFAFTIQILLSAGMLTSRPAHLAVIGIVNAYLFCRIIMEILRLPLAPDVPSLRLVNIPTSRAARAMRRARLLLATGFFGYAFISISEVLGLDHNGSNVLTLLISLAIHVEIALTIWQCRRVVGQWISGKPGEQGSFAGFRHWLGNSWHYFALFYVLALWIAWAGGIRNAFSELLRVVLVFIAALVIGNLAWNGSSALLERIFPDPSAATPRHPTILVRAQAYNPLIRGLIRVVIGILVIVLILQGWGMNAFGWLLTDPISRSLINAFVSIIITVAIALTLWEIANAFINSRIDHLSDTGQTRQAARLRTLLPMLKASIGVAISLVAGLICLSKIGVNAAPLLAGAGVLGIAIGFGSQKLVQDIITGLFLLLEDAMQVGDVITLASMTGTVERLSIRTIRLRGGDGSINIIPFSAVTTVTNMTRDFGYAQISIQVDYEEDLPRVYAVLTDIARTMRAEPAWGAMMRDDLQIFGLDQFGASALVITGQIRTGPGQHWSVRREFYGRIQKRFAEEGIEIPYTYLPPAPPKTPEIKEDENKEKTI